MIGSVGCHWMGALVSKSTRCGRGSVEAGVGWGPKAQQNFQSHRYEVIFSMRLPPSMRPSLKILKLLGRKPRTCDDNRAVHRCRNLILEPFLNYVRACHGNLRPA